MALTVDAPPSIFVRREVPEVWRAARSGYGELSLRGTIVIIASPAPIQAWLEWTSAFTE